MIRLILVVTVLAFVACTPSSKREDSGKAHAQVDSTKTLPKISVVTAEGDSVNLSTLNGPLMLILFTPDCDHCQREAKDISNHFKIFEDYTLYFVAAQTSDVLKEFAIKYNLTDKSNVVFAQGPIVPVMKLLRPTSMPTILIYNADGELVKRFDGETRVEDIEEYL
ncbi:MAG TPA: redoxin domain-containing protein [Cyclobacteriaceae bacterium]|nr:redoxin domain-containing protein [Cyclobacteriaceae bacterium]